MKKIENGQLRDMTSDEITEHEQAQADAKAQEKTFNDAVQAKENLKTSAINKLKGATYSALTDAEAKALFGE